MEIDTFWINIADTLKTLSYIMLGIMIFFSILLIISTKKINFATLKPAVAGIIGFGFTTWVFRNVPLMDRMTMSILMIFTAGVVGGLVIVFSPTDKKIKRGR